MPLSSVDDRILRLVGLYADPVKLAQVIKAVQRSEPTVPVEAMRGATAFVAEQSDSHEIDVRSDGLVTWLDSIPKAVEAAFNDPLEQEEAVRQVELFASFTLTLRARGLV